MNESPGTRPEPESLDGSFDDPVRRRRREIARWTARANRAGYALYGLAIGLFVVAFITKWNSGFTAAIAGCLVLGSLLLAPAIVLGYAIKAAEREDSDVERRRNSGRSET